MNLYNIDSLTKTTKENPEWFTRAVFGGRLVSNGYIRALTGIKGDELLGMIDLAGRVLQADGFDCAWTPNQLVKLSDKRATIKTYKINSEQCIDELENKRTLYQLSPGAKNDELPDELEEATLFLLAIALSNEIEELIIAGDDDSDPNAFNGMQTTLLSSATSIQLAGETLTKANVLAAVEKVYGAIPEEVLQSEDAGTLYMLVSYNTRRLIRNALTTLTDTVVAVGWTLDDSDKRNPKMYYLGVEVVPVKGIEKNTIIAYDSTNAYLTTDLLSDLEDIELGQFPKPNDSKIFIRGRLRLGFVVPFEDECVIMSPDIEEDRPAAIPTYSVNTNSIVLRADAEGTANLVITTPSNVNLSLRNAIVLAELGFNITNTGTEDNGDGTKREVYGVSATINNTGAESPRTATILFGNNRNDELLTITINQRNHDYDAIAAE